MAIFDLYSKRQRRQKGEMPKVYSFDDIPRPLRVQVGQIIREAVGEARNYCYQTQSYQNDEIYKFIKDTICREYGLLQLVSGARTDEEQVFNFLLHTNNTDQIIDVIEISFKLIDSYIRPRYDEFKRLTHSKLTADEAISELNIRFKEHGIGYSFTNGEILRVDSTYIHSEVTIPTISLLNNPKFEGANEEYMKAHEHYRHGRNKECLTECLKAFESTMKIICKEKGWAFDPHDTSRKLIKICFDQDLVPAFTQNQFTSLQNLLESGIPTIRNKLGGHGQGQVPQRVDDGMARYGLNLTGTNIIFLIEQSGL